MDPAVPTSVIIPEGCCVFCDSPSQSVERYGKFLHHEESGIYAHYYCMLFACGLSQRGETHEGIEGFLIKDILAERKRAQKLKCRYCKKKGASVGCSVKACHQIYHYGCGVDEEAIFLFYDSFVSYCAKHRPVQKVLPSSCSPSKGTCPICMEHVETTPGNSVLKTPCCKGTWLHRECVQQQALSAGYFFRCAICNNENEFQDEMKKFGIYLPEKDADWEFGAEAYQELYERHNRCDVDKCRCPRGRKYSTQSGQWEIVLCDLCGSAGCHVSCGGLVSSLDDWACKDCTSTFTRGFLEQNPATDRQGTVKSTSSPGSQQKRTPGQGGTRVRSAIRSQGKRPRPPPTTPRPLKKTKHSSTPVCPPLSPVSSQQSSRSSSPKSTPCPTMKFPRVSLSPTYDREDSGSGTSRESFGSKYRELLPKLDCYVALEPPSRDFPCPNLSMPSLTPASNSAKKRKSSNKLKCKKARKLDLNACNLPTETTIAQTSPSKSLSSGSGKESSVKLSWGSRLLDSVGSFLWRRSPSKAKASDNSEESQGKKATCIDTNDVQKSTLSQVQHTHVPNLPSSSLESPESHPKSNSPIALSEEVKAQIVPVRFENASNQKRKLLHDLTSWKDDSTWKEAKQDLAHLFQVEGRATRSALKKDGKTPEKSAGHERKTGTINTNDMVPEDSLLEEQLFDVHSTLSNSHDLVCSHQKSSSPVVISKEIKAQINPLISRDVPSKTRNLLQDLTSWKDDSTWKEAKGDLAHLFQVDGRATRSTLTKNRKTPVKTSGHKQKTTCINKDDMSQKPSLQKEHSDIQGSSHELRDCSHQTSNSSLELSEKMKSQIIPLTSKSTPRNTKKILNDLTSWKDDATWKEAKQDLAHLFQVDGRATRSALKTDGISPAKSFERERKASCTENVDIAEKSPVLSRRPLKVQCSVPTNLELIGNPHDSNSPKASSKVFKTPMVPSPTQSLSNLERERKANCTENVDIAEKSPVLSRRPLKVQCSVPTNLELIGNPHDSNSPKASSKVFKTPMVPSPTQSLSNLERERKANCTENVDLAEKSPVRSRRPVNVHRSLPNNPELIGNPPHDSNSPKASSKEFKTPMVPLPTQNLSRQAKNLLNDLTSWKDDATWKEAKQDLTHLYQVDGRATRSVLKKDGTQLATFTVPCSPAKKKRKYEHVHLSSQNTLPPVSPSSKIRDPRNGRWISQKASNSNEINPEKVIQHRLPPSSGRVMTESSHKHDGKNVHETQEQKAANMPVSSKSTLSTVSPSSKIRNPINGQWISKKPLKSLKINPEKVIQHKLPSSSGRVTKESGPDPDDKQLHETQEQKAANMPILPATASKELRAITSWKDDVTWKEAKGDLAYLFQVDGRTTRSVMRKDGEPESSSMAKERYTVICDPVDGQGISQKTSNSNEINPEKVIQHKLPSSSGHVMKESGHKHDDKQLHETQEQKAANMPILPATASKELRAITSWKDDVTWKEAKGDLAYLFQVDGRTTRSVMRKDGEPESSSVVKESKTTFEIPISTPVEKSHKVNQKQDVRTGCKDLGRVVTENEANSSIPKNAKSSKAYSDESNLLPLGLSSTPGKGKKGSCDLQKLTDWKNNQTWKEFREDMAVLLEVDGRTTRKKAQRDGLTGISGSPKAVTPSAQKVQELSSMPVLTKIVPGGKEVSSPNHSVLVKETSPLPSNESHIQAVIDTREELSKDVNVNSESDKSSERDLIPQSSSEIKDTTSSGVGSDSACETRKVLSNGQKKARKSLSKIFSSNLNTEDESSKGKSEEYTADMTPCLDNETTKNSSVVYLVVYRGKTSELDDPQSSKTEIVSNARDSEMHGESDGSSADLPCDVDTEIPFSELNGTDSELSVQDVEKPVLFDQSSQTTANLKEVEAYVTSMGLHYREPDHQPPVLGRQNGNFRTEYTQTYDMKYENCNTLFIPGKVQNVTNEGNRSDGELTEMPELSDGEVTPPKSNYLWKRSRTSRSYSEKKVKDSVVTMRQAVAVRRAQSCKKGLRRKGNSCSSPLPPNAATSSKISPVKKTRHVSEPPVLSPHESLSVKGNQEDVLPKVVLHEVITDAGDCKQSFGSQSTQGENVEESGKSSTSDAQNGEVIQLKGPNKGTKLDQLLQTDGRHRRRHKEPQSALHISDDTLRTRSSPRKKLSHSRCVVLSQEDPSRGDLKQSSHSPDGKLDGGEHVEHPSTSQISTMLSDVTNASSEIMKEDALSGCENSETLSDAAELCRSLVDEILTNAFKRSKRVVKRTESELLGSWTKDGLWKEAKEDVQMLLNAEKRITRSRKDSNKPKKMALSESPSLAEEKTEPGSSSNIVKPSPSRDLRKRKYCCSHMRSPWKASPLKGKSIALGIVAEPKDPQQFLPVFGKQLNIASQKQLASEKTCASPYNDSVQLNSPSEANGMKSNVHNTPASMRKVWKPRVHPSSQTNQQDSRTNVSWSSSKKFGIPRLNTEAIRKLETNKDLQECYTKKMGSPRKKAVNTGIPEPEQSVSPKKQNCDSSVVKRKVGRPRNQAAEVSKPEENGNSGRQLDDNSVVKKKVGRPRNQASENAELKKSDSPRKQLGDISDLKKKMGRPRKEISDIAEPEKMDTRRNHLPDNSEMKKKVGTIRKYPVDTTDPDKTGSPPEKKRRPRNQAVDISEQMLDFGKTSKSPNNRKLSDVKQSLQGIIAHSRNNNKARRRLEPGATHPSMTKADDDLTVCFMALQDALQAGSKVTCNSATQTDATVEEVEAYVTSRGKLYLEPWFVMPRPHLDQMKPTSDMRTQTYNLELSQCRHDETMKHESKRSPTGSKKMRSKQRAKRPSTLEKVNNLKLSPNCPSASSAKTDHSSQTELPIEEVEAHIQSMGEWYREPVIIVTGSQEVRTEVQNSVRTQTYNMNLPERELPSFKKKFSKRVHTQMKGTQTRATWEEVKAYIEENKQVYTDPNYSTTQSYFFAGSSLHRHIAVQTYLYDLDEKTSAECSEKGEQTKCEDSKGKVISASEETAVHGAAEETNDSSREALPKPVARDVLEDGEKIDTQTQPHVKLNQIPDKSCAADGKKTGNGVSNKVKTNVISSGLHSRNWFRLKPKK